MIVSISPRDRRTLIFGGALLSLLIGVFRGLPAWRHWSGQRAEARVELRRRLVFARNARRVLPALRDSVTARRMRLAALNEHVIAASTPSTAAAILGALIERISDAAGVKVNALELRPDTMARRTSMPITLRLNGEGDVASLGKFLTTVDEHDQPMTVRELSVSQSDPVPSGGRPELLRFEVVIESVALPREDGRDGVDALRAHAPAIVTTAAPAFGDRDPFRVDHRAPPMRYTGAPTSSLPIAAAEVIPRMTIRAIAGGPPWHALIDGLPGETHPMLVQPGTIVEKLTVGRITRDTVVIHDAATMGVLTFARRQ
jgi:hypothetical protein